MIWILLGAPGSGKGTQAERLRDEFGLKTISTGDMLRQAMASGSELGRQVEGIVKSGALVPDELISSVLQARLESEGIGAGVILDGFPRTVPQADLLDKMIEANQWKLGGAILCDVPVDVVVRRLGGRRMCARCGQGYHVETLPPAVEGICDKCGGELIIRADDAPDAIRKRMAVYEEQTAPLIDLYRSRNLLHVVDSSDDVDSVHQRMRQLFIGLTG